MKIFHFPIHELNFFKSTFNKEIHGKKNVGLIYFFRAFRAPGSLTFLTAQLDYFSDQLSLLTTNFLTY